MLAFCSFYPIALILRLLTSSVLFRPLLAHRAAGAGRGLGRHRNARRVDTDPQELVRHALDAYDQMAADLPYLHSAMVLRYEDLVADVAALHRSALAFMSLPDEVADFAVIDGNRRYRVPEALDPDLSLRLERWGYRPGGVCDAFPILCQHPLRDVREAVEMAGN